MRVLSHLTVRAIATTVGAAALVMALASMTGAGTTKPAQKAIQVAIAGHQMCYACHAL